MLSPLTETYVLYSAFGTKLNFDNFLLIRLTLELFSVIFAPTYTSIR